MLEIVISWLWLSWIDPNDVYIDAAFKCRMYNYDNSILGVFDIYRKDKNIIIIIFKPEDR